MEHTTPQTNQPTEAKETIPLEPRTAQDMVQAAQRLLNHLRHFPQEAASPRELAVRFGLSEAFVRDVIAGAKQRPVDDVAVLRKRISFDFVGRAYSTLRRWVAKFHQNAPVYLVASTLAAIGLVIAIEELTGDPEPRFYNLPLDFIGVIGVGVLLILGHMVCFWNHGKVRLPIVSGLIGWVLTFAFTMFAMVRDPEMVGNPTAYAQGVLGASIGLFFVATVYSGVGSGAALLGAWNRARQFQEREDSMSRQEMLERYFELEKRLEKGSTRQQVMGWFERNPVSRYYQSHPYITILVTTVITSLLARLLTKGMPDEPSSSDYLLALVILAGSFIAKTLLLTLYGFLAPRVPVAIAAGAFAGFVDAALMGIPWVSGREVWGFSPITVAFGAFLVVVYAIYTGFAGLAGDLQRRALQQEQLTQNDPAAILAEMLRIQWRLNDQTQTVTVLVVDAAKSTRMKAGADPLTAEYSFREYQEWIEAVCKEFGGKVHATAGDGAVVAFSTALAAFNAARRLQTDIDRFNHEQNRLSLPFRLRIGLHTGQVAGALDDVEFTEVIDIAAHIEASASVGGIAVTETTQALLPEFPFAPLATTVDGQRVFLALQPTE